MPHNPHATFTVDSAVELAVVERKALDGRVVRADDGDVVVPDERDRGQPEPGLLERRG